MKFEIDTPFNLPVIVTRGLVVFPGDEENIYVEREFSLNAISASRATYDNFVIVVSQKNENDDDVLSFEKVYHVGTVCHIDKVSASQNGLKIKITAVDRIHLNSFVVENNTIFCEAKIFPDEPGNPKEEEIIIRNLFQELQKIQESPTIIVKGDLNSIFAKLNKGINAREISYLLSIHLPASVATKQELLEAKDTNIRLTKLITVCLDVAKEAELEEKLQKDVRNSTEKNQKEYFLREKLKAIKKELGEGGDDNDPDSIVEKVEKGNYPQNVKNKVKDEMKKYEMLPQGSLESSLIRTYIDLLLSLPWTTSTKDNENLKEVEKILNEDHYGLEKPKKRVLEYLAVKQMTGNLKAPILCFYGPPGTGKTSLAKSIARSLNRNFVKASLGGVSDEAEIRGFKRTYVGSAPGRIIQGLKRAKTNNPVFLLDEIDKLDKSYHGNPASALLEVLDPEQNKEFQDNFIEEPFDLSNVLFICTANYLENIPAPLLDRLELIELNSYTAIEKLHIAKEHLVSKAIKNNGLNEKQIEFSDASIDFMIERYTRESGVRELERLLNSVCRKVCVDIINKKFDSIEIKPHDVKVYLGIEKFDSTRKEKGSQVGVVTGLAYTEYGGDILPIEVTSFPGKGNLVLTGKLGDVMKESASIALDYVRSNAAKYGIDSAVFDKNDIHIHVPEGAVPKDGPSAGVAMTLAIISCLTNHPISGDFALTGEVTLRGNALPIGGLREKSLAALRSGIKEIIIPIKNKNDAGELPKEVKENLKIEFMTSVDDAYKIIFETK
jgi:ATP-dependent Lon protease